MVTVDAIFEATIQLLLVDGAHRLTTTRVAHRAGVSVGTMYQYFPNKQALIYSLNERYLNALAEKIEVTCKAQLGTPIGEMVEALINTYWRAKTERVDVTQALYRSVADMDTAVMIEVFARRVDAATMAMLASAPDITFMDLPSANLALVTVIFGTVRNAFERNLTASETAALQRQMVIMCRAFLTQRQCE
ncbi:TetR/AcrR family transcriptional regulator [Brucella cytisi]|uniref:TetR/AcrR family transcriptional regulator n=1 Tax=Brucella cytisi TaxID=407152 RepID=UPI0035DD3209